MTSVSMVEVSSHTGNPIDLVEEIVVANDWAHDRASEEELILEISGRWCDYRMYFLWQEELSALHFSCGFDMKVPKRRRGQLYELLALANSKGEISLALRSIADIDSKDQAKTEQDKRGNSIRVLRYGVKQRAYGVN